MAKAAPDLDRELADLPPALRWREWICRLEAVLFASSAPVPRADLARVVGQGASVELLLEDLAAGLEGRAVELARVGAGWMLRTRPGYAAAIRAAAEVEDQRLDLSEFDIAVLAAIAYHQPVTRDGLKEIFGKEISRDLIGRAAWPRADRHRPAQPAPRRALYLRDDGSVPRRLRPAEPARPARPRAAGGRRAGRRVAGGSSPLSPPGAGARRFEHAAG